MKIIIDGKEAEVGNGADGFSPTVSVTEIDGGHQITITDAEGTQTFDVMDGQDAESEGGLSVPKIPDNTTIHNHQELMNVLGATGYKYEEVVYIGKNVKIEVSNWPENVDSGFAFLQANMYSDTEFVNGVLTQKYYSDVTIYYSYYWLKVQSIVGSSKAEGALKSYITYDKKWVATDDFVEDKIAEAVGSITVEPLEGDIPVKPITSEEYDALSEAEKNSETGWLLTDVDGGGSGKDGVTFIPSVSENGDLSWTNDGDLENPPTVNIKGPAGQDGQTGPQGTPGQNGFSPTVSITQITNGTRVTITDASGSQYFDIMNGSAYRQVLTQAQYDALATKDPNIEYCIKES